MKIEQILTLAVQKAIVSLYGQEIAENQIQIQKTRKDIAGDLTIVAFPFLRFSKKSPEDTCNEIGTYIKEHCPEVLEYSVVKGFLNLHINTVVWLNLLNAINEQENYGFIKATDQSPVTMIEYSSPNTNKPLHLGHIRNNLLGYSVAEIMKANGHKVIKTNIVNDRGIHICKSMLAWKKWGNGCTPESTGEKGDHLVGRFYVKFDQEYKAELHQLMDAAGNCSQEDAEKQSKLMAEAREMLLLWEAKDPEVYEMWKMMNEWVYAGFDITYKALGVDFDKIYYESETFLEGKNKVLEGLERGIFVQHDDQSIWADLRADGLDEKLLLRSDGTSVYMTQDIGTAKLRYDDYHIDNMIYVVGNEQNYHFQVLSILLDKLGFDWGKDLVHFSYGMVELPEGRMKSREGTVVDADDLIQEMIDAARETSEQLGKLDGYSPEQAAEVYRMVALGALKYFILKVDPKKTMMFNPDESIDFNGNTGPFLQYTYARILSIFRKAKEQGISLPSRLPLTEVGPLEADLIQSIGLFEQVVKDAGTTCSPALVANYTYDLVREYNYFYHERPMLAEADEAQRNLRLMISQNVCRIIKSGMSLLGIEMPERM